MANTSETPAEEPTREEELHEVEEPTQEAQAPATHVVTEDRKMGPVTRLVRSDGYRVVVGVLALAAFILSVVALGQIAGQDNSVGGFARPDRGSLGERLPEMRQGDGDRSNDGPRFGIPRGERPGEETPEGMDDSDAARS